MIPLDEPQHDGFELDENNATAEQNIVEEKTEMRPNTADTIHEVL